MKTTLIYGFALTLVTPVVALAQSADMVDKFIQSRGTFALPIPVIPLCKPTSLNLKPSKCQKNVSAIKLELANFFKNGIPSSSSLSSKWKCSKNMEFWVRWAETKTPANQTRNALKKRGRSENRDRPDRSADPENH